MAPAPVFSSPPYYAPSAPPRTLSVFGGIAIAVVMVLALVFAVVSPVPNPSNTAEAVGYHFGLVLRVLLLPLIIAYPIAGRKKARNPNLFAGLFCGIGLAIMLLSVAGARLETTDQKMARLMREAAGLQPVRNSLFGGKDDARLRSFFKEIIAINKEYQEAADKIDTSATHQLNTPESFADPDSAADGLKQLHAAFALDARQEERMAQVLENFTNSFDDLSASDREEMMKGFNAGMAQVMPARKRAISAEKDWIDAIDEVYGYAQSHHADIHLVDGRLVLASNQELQEFNERVNALNTKRTDFIQAKADFDKLQSQNLQKLGMNRQQTGLR